MLKQKPKRETVRVSLDLADISQINLKKEYVAATRQHTPFRFYAKHL